MTSMIALTYMIISMALSFAYAIKRDFDVINLKKAKCIISLVALHLIIGCVSAGSDLFCAIMYYKTLFGHHFVW